MNNLLFAVKKGKSYYDLSQFVTKVVWSGRKGAAPRTIDVTLFDSETVQQIEKKVDVADGQACLLYDRDAKKTLFQGIIMSQQYSEKRLLVIKAYDICVKLTNNKASFTYKKKTASQIVKSCLNKLGLPVGKIASTSHTIKELVKKGTTYWDVIEDALSQEYLSTGYRYYLYASGGKVNLIRRKRSNTMPIIELKSNVESYDYTRSIENTRTRLKLITSKGTVKKTIVMKDLEKKIGKFQEVESVDEKISSADMNKRIKTFKSEKGVVGQTLTVTCTGDSSVIAGGCVYVRLTTLDMKRVFFVEEDTHTWEKGKHTMKLKLDFEKSKS